MLFFFAIFAFFLSISFLYPVFMKMTLNEAFWLCFNSEVYKFFVIKINFINVKKINMFVEASRWLGYTIVGHFSKFLIF